MSGSEFKEKTVVITGGSSGIGYAAAKQFSAEGANVVITGRNPEKLEHAAGEISALGGNCTGKVVSVSDDRGMESLFAMIRERFDTIDILFANAGINGVWAPIDDMTVKEWDETYATNVRGVFITLHHAVPLMKEKGGAIIINSSVNGTRVFINKGATAYASSKSAVTTISRMLAIELAQYGIRVNAICPGPTDTNIPDSTINRGADKILTYVEYPNGFIPLCHGVIEDQSTWVDAEQVANAVKFLSGEKAAMITGTELWIDGAHSLIM
jgi:NAD(P)-dependent dehydrogenase (short-subunit alcohol dehydrogenase family)